MSKAIHLKLCIATYLQLNAGRQAGAFISYFTSIEVNIHAQICLCGCMHTQRRA